MYAILAILIMIAGGLANTLRGRAILPRWAFYLVMGALAFAASGMNWWYGTLWVIASFVWLSAPWGEGFAAITGRMSSPLGKNPTIEKICFKIVPDPYANADAAKSWGFWFMFFRGLFYLYPLFLVLAYITGQWPLLILGLFSGLQGACYRMFGCVPEGNLSVACAEVLMGMTLGLLIVMSVITIGQFHP
jgi:hypothetical protein